MSFSQAQFLATSTQLDITEFNGHSTAYVPGHLFDFSVHSTQH